MFDFGLLAVTPDRRGLVLTFGCGILGRHYDHTHQYAFVECEDGWYLVGVLEHARPGR